MAVFQVDLPNSLVLNNPKIIKPINNKKKNNTPELNGNPKSFTKTLSNVPIKLAVFGIRIPCITIKITEEINKALNAPQ